jgi:hypothetical protein
MTIETSKSENFLQINNLDNGIIIFTCRLNLECLCSVDEIFMVGTFRCCPNFFYTALHNPWISKRKLHSLSDHTVAVENQRSYTVVHFPACFICAVKTV